MCRKEAEIQYHQPVNAPTNASYIDANANAGVTGSSPPAAAIEFPQREIVNAITLGGLSPTDSDMTQLWQVINNSSKIYVVDTGTVNNIVVTPTPPILAYRPGQAFEIKCAVTNTGATTINASGLGTRNAVRENGTAMLAGDIVGGGIALFVFDGTNFQLLTSAGSLVSEQSLLHYGVDIGVANAYVATVTPGVVAYDNGLTCLIYITHANTGASTINIQGLGVKPFTRNSGATLQPGDVVNGGFALTSFDGTNWELLNPLIPAAAGTSLDQSITGPLRPYFIAVNSATITSPPASPTVGDTYLVPVGASGAWTGLDNQVSQWAGSSAGWRTVNMPVQTCVGVADQDDIWKRTSTGWRSIFANLAEAAAGISTTLAVTPADLRQAASILGPLRHPFIAVNSVQRTSPPPSPVLGDVYIVPAGASGVWSGLTNYAVQWNGTTWINRMLPTLTYVGCQDTGDLFQLTPSGWRSGYATLAEALAGTSTITIINPADLAYVLSHLPGQGDELNSDLFFFGCFR